MTDFTEEDYKNLNKRIKSMADNLVLLYSNLNKMETNSPIEMTQLETILSLNQNLTDDEEEFFKYLSNIKRKLTILDGFQCYRFPETGEVKVIFNKEQIANIVYLYTNNANSSFIADTLKLNVKDIESFLRHFKNKDVSKPYIKQRNKIRDTRIKNVKLPYPKQEKLYEKSLEMDIKGEDTLFCDTEFLKMIFGKEIKSPENNECEKE